MLPTSHDRSNVSKPILGAHGQTDTWHIVMAETGAEKQIQGYGLKRLAKELTTGCPGRKGARCFATPMLPERRRKREEEKIREEDGGRK